MNLYRPKENIINLATWLDLLAYAIGVMKDNQSCVKFMTISSTTARVRWLKLRATCIETLITFLHIDWCMNFCYYHIGIYIFVIYNEMWAWIWFGLNFWWNVCVNTILSSNDGWADVSSLITTVWLVATGALTLATIATGHHRSNGWLTS
jgi:hypothetical protein